MKIAEIITEGIIPIFGRSKGKVVRKYRCTSGTRKGRIVAKPATCNAAKKVSSMITMKKARRARSSVLQIKSSRRKRTGATSKRIAKLNNPLSQKRYGKAKSRRKSINKPKGYTPPHKRVARKITKGGPSAKRRKPTRKKIK